MEPTRNEKKWKYADRAFIQNTGSLAEGYYSDAAPGEEVGEDELDSSAGLTVADLKIQLKNADGHLKEVNLRLSFMLHEGETFEAQVPSSVRNIVEAQHNQGFVSQRILKENLHRLGSEAHAVSTRFASTSVHLDFKPVVSELGYRLNIEAVHAAQSPAIPLPEDAYTGRPAMGLGPEYNFGGVAHPNEISFPHGTVPPKPGISATVATFPTHNGRKIFYTNPIPAAHQNTDADGDQQIIISIERNTRDLQKNLQGEMRTQRHYLLDKSPNASSTTIYTDEPTGITYADLFNTTKPFRSSAQTIFAKSAQLTRQEQIDKISVAVSDPHIGLRTTGLYLEGIENASYYASHTGDLSTGSVYDKLFNGQKHRRVIEGTGLKAVRRNGSLEVPVLDVRGTALNPEYNLMLLAPKKVHSIANTIIGLEKLNEKDLQTKLDAANNEYSALNRLFLDPTKSLVGNVRKFQDLSYLQLPRQELFAHKEDYYGRLRPQVLDLDKSLAKQEKKSLARNIAVRNANDPKSPDLFTRLTAKIFRDEKDLRSHGVLELSSLDVSKYQPAHLVGTAERLNSGLTSLSALRVNYRLPSGAREYITQIDRANKRATVSFMVPSIYVGVDGQVKITSARDTLRHSLNSMSEASLAIPQPGRTEKRSFGLPGEHFSLDNIRDGSEQAAALSKHSGISVPQILERVAEAKKTPLDENPLGDLIMLHDMATSKGIARSIKEKVKEAIDTKGVHVNMPVDEHDWTPRFGPENEYIKEMLGRTTSVATVNFNAAREDKNEAPGLALVHDSPGHLVEANIRAMEEVGVMPLGKMASKASSHAQVTTYSHEPGLDKLASMEGPADESALWNKSKTKPRTQGQGEIGMRAAVVHIGNKDDRDEAFYKIGEAENTALYGDEGIVWVSDRGFQKIKDHLTSEFGPMGPHVSNNNTASITSATGEKKQLYSLPHTDSAGNTSYSADMKDEDVLNHFYNDHIRKLFFPEGSKAMVQSVKNIRNESGEELDLIFSEGEAIKRGILHSQMLHAAKEQGISPEEHFERVKDKPGNLTVPIAGPADTNVTNVPITMTDIGTIKVRPSVRTPDTRMPDTPKLVKRGTAQLTWQHQQNALLNRVGVDIHGNPINLDAAMAKTAANSRIRTLPALYAGRRMQLDKEAATEAIFGANESGAIPSAVREKMNAELEEIATSAKNLVYGLDNIRTSHEEQIAEFQEEQFSVASSSSSSEAKNAALRAIKEKMELTIEAPRHSKASTIEPLVREFARHADLNQGEMAHVLAHNYKQVINVAKEITNMHDKASINILERLH